MNLYLDQSKDRRKRQIEELKAQAGGNCRTDGAFDVENALRGQWNLTCDRGTLRAIAGPTMPLTGIFNVAPARCGAAVADERWNDESHDGTLSSDQVALGGTAAALRRPWPGRQFPALDVQPSRFRLPT